MEKFTGIVEKIVNGGWGIVRSKKGTVFLKKVCPGEKVRFSIREKSRGINWGEIHEIISISDARTDPSCPYYDNCGGCSLLHVKYSEQIKLKLEILKDDLKRIGGISFPDIGIESSPQFKYRIRVKLKGLTSGKIGFIKKSTNDVIRIDHCMNACDQINEFINNWNMSENPPFFNQIDMLINIENKISYAYLSSEPEEKDKLFFDKFDRTVFSWKRVKSSAVSELKIGETIYLVSPELFFQVNRFMWEKMISNIENLLVLGNNAVDIFTGCGFFLPLLQKYYKNVAGVESVSTAAELAAETFPDTKIFRMAAEKINLKNVDAVIVDPPRSGLGIILKEEIIKNGVERLIYVSCSTATLARDLKYFAGNGYSVSSMKMMDMFPNTSHIETITLLTKD